VLPVTLAGAVFSQTLLFLAEDFLLGDDDHGGLKKRRMVESVGSDELVYDGLVIRPGIGGGYSELLAQEAVGWEKD